MFQLSPLQQIVDIDFGNECSGNSCDSVNVGATSSASDVEGFPSYDLESDCDVEADSTCPVDAFIEFCTGLLICRTLTCKDFVC